MRRCNSDFARRLAAPIGFAIVLALAAAAHALTFPQLTGRVVDEANILDAPTRQALTEKLAAVEAKSGDQIVVVTLGSLQGTSIEDYGYQLGRHWAVGQKGNHGAMRPPSRRVLEQRRSHERSDEPTDDRANDGHRHTHDSADESAYERSPPGTLRPAVFLSIAEADPRLEYFAQYREADDDDEKRGAERLEIGEPAVADDAEQDDPETGQAEWYEHQTDEARPYEENHGGGVGHSPSSTATSSRMRSRLSRLIATTCCHVPSTSSPSTTGRDKLVLSSADRT
jgi:hypothetical protein